MKRVAVLFFVLVGAAVHAAGERIYRCGNEYTNTVTEAQMKNCKLISGANVSVVQAARPAAKPAAAPPSQTEPVGGSLAQRAKDIEARSILDAELKRSEARQAELLKEFNSGEPDKLGAETRNHQKYLDRLASLKAAISRNEADIEGIRRELGRMPPGSAAPAAK
jgi:type IV secretory pathway VirB4 component